MAHQDYVGRSRPKKNNAYKKNVAPQASVFTFKLKLITSLVTVLLTAGGYTLWSLSKIEPMPVESANSIEKSHSTTKAQDELPAPPEEKWDYMEDLKNKEVEAGSEYVVTKKGPYQMQCGSFRTISQAEQLKANIAFTGLTSLIKKTTGSKGVYYRVILGPYEKKRQAERDKHKLKNNNINYCEIWLWR